MTPFVLLFGLSACLADLVEPAGTDDLIVEHCPFYPDLDGDSYGDPYASTSTRCDAPPQDYVAAGGDCDDGDPNINPGAEEVCDHVDNNCSGEVDEDMTSDWYRDADGDGHGAGDLVALCEDEQGAGWSLSDDDCDDGDGDTYPGAPILCDEADRNCDGIPDDWDADGDGYAGCAECDDDDPTSYPGGEELCDEVDNDCDENVDEDASDLSIFWGDWDEDGYGNPEEILLACYAPKSHVENRDDCDDLDAAIHPGADELCDDVDQDCDDDVDEDATDAPDWYYDGDEDGWGLDGVTAADCEAPADHVAAGGDCDDGDDTIHPEADELCDEINQDCDAAVDEDATDATTWYPDEDEDNWGTDEGAVTACEQPERTSINSGDCDDTDRDISPDAPEICDGIDNNCDEAIDPTFDDTDGDGVADCVDDCPVFAEPLAASGDGSESSPYASIADAILLRGGYCDQIRLLPGTYAESVDYDGVDLEIIATDGPTTTIIEPSEGAGAIFRDGEGAGAVLEGVTIQGGTGEAQTEGSTDTLGGAIYVEGADPTIRGCVLTGNTATYGGSAVMLYRFGGLFEDNEIVDNLLDIDGSESVGSDAGGAVLLFDADGALLHNVIRENEGSYGGAVTVFGGAPTIAGNLIAENFGDSYGGGLSLYGAEGVVYNNLILGHDGYGVALLPGDESAFLNNLVMENAVGLTTSSWLSTASASPGSGVVNNIIVENGAGIAATDYEFAGVTFTHNDVWDNTADYDGLLDYTGSHANIASDPDLDLDLRPNPSSPVIDAGDDVSAYGVTDDIEGAARPVGGVFDIGPYEQ